MQEPREQLIYAVKIDWYSSEERLPSVNIRRFVRFSEAKRYAAELDGIGSPIYKTEVVTV